MVLKFQGEGLGKKNISKKVPVTGGDATEKEKKKKSWETLPKFS